MTQSTHTPEYAKLRSVLRNLRKDAKLSQRAVAKIMDVPHTWVSKVETGERRIDVVELQWFCEACGASMKSVLGLVFGETSMQPVGSGARVRKKTNAIASIRGNGGRSR